MGSFEGGWLAGGMDAAGADRPSFPSTPPHYLFNRGFRFRRPIGSGGILVQEVPTEQAYRVYTRGLAPGLRLAASSVGISARAETKPTRHVSLNRKLFKLPGHLARPVP